MDQPPLRSAADSRLPPSFWLLLLGIPALFFSLMVFVDGRQTVAERWWISEVEGVLADTDQPPGAEADWDRVSIPQSFIGTPGGSSLWWRFELPPALRAPGLEWMLVVPFPRQTNFALWIDERPLATRGDLESDRSMLRNPVSFSVTNPPTGPPPQTAYLRTTSPLPDLWMSSVVIGPKPELAEYANYVDVVQRFTIQAIMAMMALMAAIMGSVLLLRRGRDPVYGWYAALLLIWTVHLSHSQNEHPPFGTGEFWRDASIVTLGWFAIVAAVFVDRLTGQRRPKLDLGLVSWGLVGTLLVLARAFDEPLNVFFVVRIWVPSIIGIGLLILINLLVSLRRQPTLETRSLLILAAFLVLVGLRDYAHSNLTIIDGNVLYLPFAAGLALIVFSVILIRRFVAALDAAERLNNELETRVREKALELDAQYEKTRAMEHDQVLTRERQRLLQEMHDGLGGHLVHALATAERSDQLQTMIPPLKLALEDLRLIIDSLDPSESAFVAVFSSLRARFAHTANALGLRFTWQFDPKLGEIALNPHEVLTLGRIVQEAVTNVIKHAEATELTILATYERISGRVSVTITDNGIGLSEHSEAGRGLTSMKSRATELGGDLRVIPLESGTRIEIVCYPEQNHNPDALTSSGDASTC